MAGVAGVGRALRAVTVVSRAVQVKSAGIVQWD